MYENLNIVRDNILGEQGQQLERDTRALFKDWKTIRNEVINLVSKGNTKAASVITRNKEAEHVLYLERHMNDLVSYARNKAGGFLENTDSIQEGVMLNVSIFICVVILLFVVSGYLLLTGIMTNIESLNTTMSKITETGILIKSDMTGTHEIAVLSHHFNKLVEKLLDQIWLRDCQNDLNRELSGGHSYDDLLRLSVKYVSERVDACAGALFTQNEDRSLFELKSSYALAAGKQFASAFKPGEGIVGQVAVGERPILLKNVTREEALIKTATVSEPPKNIYALPLRFKNNMLGVLEVASFQEINTVKKEFLDSAADIIATSMFATSQNNIIKTLLDASHEDNLKLLAQAKEMRAQAEELRAQAQELEEINEEFRQQSEELQTQNVELEVQSQRVEEANRLKSEFLSNMSHELRTPLNSVLALSRLLISQASNVLSADQAKYLEVIERNGKNLLALINNILDLSRIEAGKLDIFPNLFSLVSLMETLVESLSPLAEEKNIKLHLTIPAELPWIESDESRVYQICQNLIGNAIKFTSRGHVKVSVFDDGQKVYINVKDTGIGISQKDLPIIFDEFRQVDGSSSRHYEGTGLGLAIARKAARILGGDITVESVLDQGSTFSLVFPIHWREKLIAKKSELISAPSDINGNERKETTTVVNDDPLSSSKPHKSARKIDYKNNSPRILLVEDNESAVIQVMSALKNEGYTLDVARNGQEALNYIKQSIPDGIIMDLMMPEIDGFEVLESMRGISKTANIPVLILTAKDLTKEDLKQLTSNNIQQLIQKGDVDRDELLRKTRMMLG
ncbi:response regulator, partial [bacterium]|nr:response regulator [bacterium]